MTCAAIYIPEFPAVAWLRLEPAAHTYAVAVVEGSAPLERIVSFNRAAKRCGLTRGMNKVQAETLGQFVFRARDVAEEKTALDLVLEIAGLFSPRVQIIASPVNAYAKAKHLAAALLLDQRGTEMLFGDASSYAEKVRAALLGAGFPANVAVAPNAEASLILARSYAGVCCVDEQAVTTRLARLPLAALRCEPTLLSTLTRWGIRNLGELADLPEAGLISRVGQQGMRLQRLARGTEDHLMVPEEPAFVLRERTLLDSPLDSLESLLFILSPMLDTLLKQAVDHAYALRSVTVTLEVEKHAPHEVEVKPAVPSQRRDLLLKLLHLKLQANPPQAGILAVHVSAEPAVPQIAQNGLFQTQFPEPGKLDLLIARLKALVGENNVGSPALVNSHRDDEFVMATFQPAAVGKLERSAHRRAHAALRRVRPAQPIKVSLRGASPVWIFWKGERFEVIKATGPWQSSGYWWDGRRWAANEWDAIVATPLQTLRLCHEPQADTWFLAGIYD